MCVTAATSRSTTCPWKRAAATSKQKLRIGVQARDERGGNREVSKASANDHSFWKRFRADWKLFTRNDVFHFALLTIQNPICLLCAMWRCHCRRSSPRNHWFRYLQNSPFQASRSFAFDSVSICHLVLIIVCCLVPIKKCSTICLCVCSLWCRQSKKKNRFSLFCFVFVYIFCVCLYIWQFSS